MTSVSSAGNAPQRSLTTRRLDERESRDQFFLMPDPEVDSSPVVMVIDDSPAVRRVVELSLQRVGIPAISFPDGIAAMTAIRDQQMAPPRVLLLDIALPRMSGYDVAKHLRKNPAFSETQIIMLSGYDGVFNQMLAKIYGAVGFISKPFHSGELVKRVCEALGVLAVTEW